MDYSRCCDHEASLPTAPTSSLSSSSPLLLLPLSLYSSVRCPLPVSLPLVVPVFMAAVSSIGWSRFRRAAFRIFRFRVIFHVGYFHPTRRTTVHPWELFVVLDELSGGFFGWCSCLLHFVNNQNAFFLFFIVFFREVE